MKRGAMMMLLAPTIKHYGEAPIIDADHPYVRLNVDFMDWLMFTFGNSAGKLRYMYYLVANKEGYSVVNKTVQERIGLAPPNQSRIRNELEAEGWIFYDAKENTIGLRWDNIKEAVDLYTRTRGLEAEAKRRKVAEQQKKRREERKAEAEGREIEETEEREIEEGAPLMPPAVQETTKQEKKKFVF